jgi:hypothetical protein
MYYCPPVFSAMSGETKKSDQYFTCYVSIYTDGPHTNVSTELFLEGKCWVEFSKKLYVKKDIIINKYVLPFYI